MTKPSLALGLALAVWVALPLAAEDSPQAVSSPAAASEEADHEALRALRALYEEAAAKGDPAALEPHLAPDFTGVMIKGNEVVGYAGLAEFWRGVQQQMGEGGHYSVQVLAAEKSRIFGDIALARGSTEDRIVTGAGRELRFTSQWTAVCQKIDGRWKLLRVQGTLDPLDNPFLDGVVAARSYQVGGLALLAGLVLGFLAGRRRRG